MAIATIMVNTRWERGRFRMNLFPMDKHLVAMSMVPKYVDTSVCLTMTMRTLRIDTC